jgi:predicted RNase H-like HicB family nuclease
MPEGGKMRRRLTLIYWKSDKFWLGKLLEYPEIMTQGETLEELEENIKDAYLLMAMDDVPDGYHSKEIAI